MFGTLTNNKIVRTFALGVIASIGMTGIQAQIANAGTLTFTPIDVPLGQSAPNATNVGGQGETTTVTNNGKEDLIISGIMRPYKVSWGGFDSSVKVIADGITDMGTSGSITVNPGDYADGMIKVWGVMNEDLIDITNHLPEDVQAELVDTPEPASLIGLLVIGGLGLKLKQQKN